MRQTYFRNPGRPIMSRHDQAHVDILVSLKPGQKTDGCLVCCNAPACCPLCSSVCPCCGESEYVIKHRAASTYIHLREHSLEWNEPNVILQPGICCGVDPCLFKANDHVNVLYYDDDMLQNVSDQTRFCNEFLTCMFGGSGERIRLTGPACCFGLCIRANSYCCMFVPICCPKIFCPCMMRHDIFVEDAQKGLYELRKARDAAIAPLLRDAAAATTVATTSQPSSNRV